MYPVEFASETARHTLDLSTAQSKACLLLFFPLVLLYVWTHFLCQLMFCSVSQRFWRKRPHIPGIRARALFLSALPSLRAVL